MYTEAECISIIKYREERRALLIEHNSSDYNTQMRITDRLSTINRRLYNLTNNPIYYEPYKNASRIRYKASL